MTHIPRASGLLAFAILVLGGCAEVPPAGCPKCPETAAAPGTAPRYEPVPFAGLPGWATTELAPGLRAFIAGCPRIPSARPLGRLCAAVPGAPTDEAAARRFIEDNFSAW